MGVGGNKIDGRLGEAKNEGMIDEIVHPGGGIDLVERSGSAIHAN